MSWLRKLFGLEQPKPEPPPPKPEALSNCVIEAVFCAWVYGMRKEVPVRIIAQKIVKTAKEDTDHSQAEALIRGKWVPLTPAWSKLSQRIKVKKYRRHFPDVEPYRYVDLWTWISEQYQYTNQGDRHD